MTPRPIWASGVQSRFRHTKNGGVMEFLCLQIFSTMTKPRPISHQRRSKPPLSLCSTTNFSLKVEFMVSRGQRTKQMALRVQVWSSRQKRRPHLARTAHGLLYYTKARVIECNFRKFMALCGFNASFAAVAAKFCHLKKTFILLFWHL